MANLRTLEVTELKTRLDKFLAGHFLNRSRSSIQRDIEKGLVKVNGVAAEAGKQVVRRGDLVKYHPADSQDSRGSVKPANLPLKILYNDHGLLIIDKPAGLVVHPGAGFRGHTLASALLYHFSGSGSADIGSVGESDRPGIVHRLDKDTSGVMLVARTAPMHDYLKNAFAERKVKKEYLALVWGRVDKTFGSVDLPLGKSRADFRKQTTQQPVDPKPALTEYRVLEYLPPSGGLDCYTLLLVKLHTGRTHQIRVHMASLGHPLVGDSLYGGKNRLAPAGLSRQFLHAKKIEVRLPEGTWIEAEAELPPDLRAVLERLHSKKIQEL